MSFERIIPVLVCKDIVAEHDFLVNTLGFASGGIHRTPEGEAVHGEVRAGGSTIWLHREAPEHRLAAAGSLSAASSGLVVHVDDVDAHYAMVCARGGKPERQPQDMEYGQREYGITDPEGQRWWFASLIK